MRTIVAALALVCAVTLVPAAARADTPVRRTLEKTAPAAPHVRIEDAAGDVKVVGDDCTTVRVPARIHASTDEAANSVGVEITRSGDESVVAVNIPHPSPGIWQLLDKRRLVVDLIVNVPHTSMLTAKLAIGYLDVRPAARLERSAAYGAHASRRRAQCACRRGCLVAGDRCAYQYRRRDDHYAVAVPPEAGTRRCCAGERLLARILRFSRSVLRRSRPSGPSRLRNAPAQQRRVPASGTISSRAWRDLGGFESGA